jgi:glycosyltransferase 2 family protein
VTAKRVLWRVAQVALVILITWGIVRTLAPDLAKVSLDDFRELNPSYTKLLIATAALIGFYLMHAWLWRGITADLGQRRIDYRTALHIYFVSGLGRYIPGKLWQVAGMALLAQRAGISAVAATAASVLAQFAFISSGLIYLAVVMPTAMGVATPLIAALVIFALMAVGFAVRHWIAGKIKRLGPVILMLDQLTLARGVKWWLAYGLSWIVLGLAFVLFTSAFVMLDRTDYRQVAGAVAAAYLSGLVFILSVAGLGVREAVMGTLLLAVTGNAPAAALIAVASRVWFTIGELIPIAFGKHRTVDNARPGHHPDV